jgi:hypothetical protein
MVASIEYKKIGKDCGKGIGPQQMCNTTSFR